MDKRPFNDEESQAAVQTPAEENVFGLDQEPAQAVDRGPVDDNSEPTTVSRTVEAEEPVEEPKDPRSSEGMFSKTQKRILVGISAGALVVTGAWLGGGERTTEDIQAEQAEADRACADTWAVVQIDQEDSKIVAAGLPSLGAALTTPEARAAANEGVNFLKHDPEVLADTTNLFSNKYGVPTAYKAENLHDGECFTREGEEAANTLQAIMADSEITPDDPLPTDINTGADANGRMVRDSEPGLTGDLSGITIVLSNGERIGWLDRCGNFTFGTPPELPVGPTDEDKPKVTTTVPGVTPTTRPKETTTTTDRVTTATTEPPEECPPGSVPFEDRCVHRPITDGHEGPASQPGVDPGRTPGYTPGNAEKVVEQQERETPGGLDPTEYGTEVPDSRGGGKAPGGGEESVISRPDSSAPDNPEYEPEATYPGTNEGTRNDADGEDADTGEYDDQTSAPGSDPGGF